MLRAAVLVLLCLLPGVVVAQNADVLTGRVTGTDGEPVVGARVTVISVETEITRSVLTDRNGRYMINFPDGGGRYVLRISFIGMADVVRTVVREAEEELLLTNVTMQPQAIQLNAIEVTANRPPPGRGQAGEQTTELPQEVINRLPLPDLDPNTLALLAAGVVGTSADSLSGRMGFSVAGMSDLLNQIVLDGVILGEGGLSVPEEGVRRTQVTTSTFDASRGGFAGGQVSMTTARGNNRFGGSLSYRFDDDALQVRATPTVNAFTTHNIGGSVGGPLIRNKLFYNASFQMLKNVNHRFALSVDDPQVAQRSGVSPDSVGRFLDILGDQYGFSTLGQTGPYRQLSDDLRAQGRLDWNIMQGGGQSHTLSARFNLNINDQDSTRISILDLAAHGGESERNNRLGALTLSSRWGANWTNALNLSFSENWSDALPYLVLPEGRVRVTSDFEDGTRGTTSMVFGGNRSMPTESYNRDLQLSNDLSFLLPVGAQLHRLKLGGSMQKSRSIDRSTDNLYGSFTFNSLADFEANRPERYERSLSERQSRTGVLNTGLYFGDTWRISQPLELTLGLRWDRAELDQRPAYNPEIERIFGRRTDIDPVSTTFSPRIGFNYRLPRPTESSAVKSLSGGVGLFAGRAPTNIYSAAVRQTGLPNAEQRLICIGAAVPTPDWDLYLADPLGVPDACADGGPGVPDGQSSRAPTVTLIDPDQRMPASLRFDLGYRTVLPFNLNANVRYTYSRGLGLWGYYDLNLDESRAVQLGREQRPFFGDPGAIVEQTGAVSLASSRVHEEFGNVYDVRSDRASTAHQVSLSINGFLPARITLSANYTLGWARDQASGSFGGSTTAGNPNQVEWSTSNQDRRHTLNLTFAKAISDEIELTAMVRTSSGSPFTPIVNRDINGDGSRNDRAFVFDPATAGDTALVNGMDRLLGTVPGRIASCLKSQFGGIAERNSCRNGWSQNLDFRASFRPNLPTVQRRLTISLDARNALTGLDQLVNGKNNMRGWGEERRVESTLLEVQGFDRSTNTFLYSVNEAFGQSRRGQSAFTRPFSLTLSARLAVGGQAFQNNRGLGPPMAMGGFGGGRGGFGGGFGGFEGGRGNGPGGGFGGMADLLRGGANADPQALVGSILMNPVDSLIARKDSLGLNETQLARLGAISDSLNARFAVRRETLMKAASELAPLMQGNAGGMQANPQTVQRLRELQPQIEGARSESTLAMRQAQNELTAEQWQKVPARLRGTGGQGAGRGGFNAVGLLDRMLVNPLPVLLSLGETLKLTPDQVSSIQTVSRELDEKLAHRREELGKRFDNVQPGQQQGQVFQQIQPDIEAGRNEIRAALTQVEKLLTSEQWKQVPERIRNPFQNNGGPGGGRRGQ